MIPTFTQLEACKLNILDKNIQITLLHSGDR